MNEKKRLLIARLKEKLKEIIKKEMEEGTGTGVVAAPATPYAFAKSGKGNERAATASTDYELVKEGKKAEKKPAKKSEPAPVAKKAAPAAPKKQDDTKITTGLIDKISSRERENKFKGDDKDVNLLARLKDMLGRNVGRTLEEADVQKMIDEIQCDECWEEVAKPDFLDLDGDGNTTEPMKQAAKDAKNKNKK